MNIQTAQLTADEISKLARNRRNARRRMWRNVGAFFTSRSRDLALLAIVLGAFVAVFDGSLYSARAFSFHSWSAYAFAIMPDALMVLSAAKMRQRGIAPEQWKVARRAMRFSLGFSIFTNMVAAFLRSAPESMVTDEIIFAGSVMYHGVVVVFLWLAVETLTKVRADRKGRKVIGQAVQVTASVKRSTGTKVAPATATAVA